MVAQTGKLRLFEALELRSEYDARLKTLSECLPEKQENRGRLLFHDDEVVRRPAQGFEVAAVRRKIDALEQKRRDLNAAIQETNFRNSIQHDAKSISLAAALDLRKALNSKIGELHSMVISAAWERVIYKEGRDIVQESHLDFAASEAELDQARHQFRELNRKLRTASFELEVDFRDD